MDDENPHEVEDDPPDVSGEDPPEELQAVFVNGRYEFRPMGTGSGLDVPPDDELNVVAMVPQPDEVHSPYTIEGTIQGLGNFAAGANRKGGRAKSSVRLIVFLLYGLPFLLALVALLLDAF